MEFMKGTEMATAQQVNRSYPLFTAVNSVMINREAYQEILPFLETILR
jgi:hypothetical protein